MQVSVRLYALLRERAGSTTVTVDLPDDARVGDALEVLGDLTRGVPVMMAVNRDQADVSSPLAPDDELALVPAVSGGDGGPVHTRIAKQPISLDDVTARVRDPRAGAVVTFQGVTRDVERLEYEGYVTMAERRLRQIAEEVADRHELCALAIEHRVGSVPLSEPSVIVAASAPHRPEAFLGAREAIDRVKSEAPIWKKEFLDGSGRWVEGTRVSRPVSR